MRGAAVNSAIPDVASLIRATFAKEGAILPAHTQALIEKFEALPAERIAEVEDFVDFIWLREQERALTRSASDASAPAFAAIWNNPDDDAYDAL